MEAFTDICTSQDEQVQYISIVCLYVLYYIKQFNSTSTIEDHSSDEVSHIHA